MKLGRKHLHQRSEENEACSFARSWRHGFQNYLFQCAINFGTARNYLGEVMVKIVGSASFKIFGFLLEYESHFRNFSCRFSSEIRLSFDFAVICKREGFAVICKQEGFAAICKREVFAAMCKL